MFKLVRAQSVDSTESILVRDRFSAAGGEELRKKLEYSYSRYERARLVVEKSILAVKN
jgi:hypothetical protein